MMKPNANTAFDPITLEVLRNALEATAQEMGAVLKLTAFSPNIKERMDASCAIFDARAQLVAQAEHVPVHLGSMLRAVSTTVAAVDSLSEGDVILVNDPYVGGSHLPDVMLIAPVFFGAALVGYAATRAHQADVGGVHGSCGRKHPEIQSPRAGAERRRAPSGRTLPRPAVRRARPPARAASRRAPRAAPGVGSWV